MRQPVVRVRTPREAGNGDAGLAHADGAPDAIGGVTFRAKGPGAR